MARTIAVLATQDVQLLDVSGPLDVFAEANVQSGELAYCLRIVAGSAGPIRSSSGVRLIPDWVVGSAIAEPIDTLLVAGSPTAAVSRPDAHVVDWLRRTAPATRRYGSVCAGAFLLAEAGLLEGRRITTHWAVTAQFKARYSSVRVEADAIYVRDGSLRTAAGVTAGLDLALALVEEDLGRTMAMAVAAQLVMSSSVPVDRCSSAAKVRLPRLADPRCRRCSGMWRPIRPPTTALQRWRRAWTSARGILPGCSKVKSE